MQITQYDPDYHRLVLKHKVITKGMFTGHYDQMTGQPVNSIWRECDCGQKFH